ncbi:unnamed protein product [Urochloa decumbens]|uniref:F-box domain-containing protein n=1 Tax=Urochloa decumbens TaxID=240449 RepID=A0ABC9FL80_9POAL
MEMAASSKRKRSLYEEEDLVDRISGLPDDVLGDIVSLLPTMDGARTQILSSRWRHIWRSAPLNLDLVDLAEEKYQCVSAGETSRILSAHQGPGRRFRTELQYLDLHSRRPAAVLNGWLRSPALDNLQELEFHYGYRFPRGFRPLPPPPRLPASVRRFSSTLRVASFAGCRFSKKKPGALHLPVLKQLSLVHAPISESSLDALLAGCPVLQSLLLSYNSGYSRVRIVSRTLISVGVFPASPDGRRQHLILEDAPCLQRLLIFPYSTGYKYIKIMDISIISAPKLDVLGPLNYDLSRLEVGTTVFEGPRLVSFTTVARSVKILALQNEQISLDVVINFMKCFPCLVKLYIKMAGSKNGWSREYHNFVMTHDIRLKKVVLLNYQGNKDHVNFAKFFVLNAKVLESMVLELEKGITLSTEWIERQHKRLHTKNRASRGAEFDFVDHDSLSGLSGYVNEAQTHDLSMADPFVEFRAWSI